MGRSPRQPMPKQMLAAMPPRRISSSSTRKDSETLCSWSGISWSANLPGKVIKWSVAMEPVTAMRTGSFSSYVSSGSFSGYLNTRGGCAPPTRGPEKTTSIASRSHRDGQARLPTYIAPGSHDRVERACLRGRDGGVTRLYACRGRPRHITRESGSVEGVAAGARACGIRVVDREALLLDGVDEVDGGSAEVRHAHPVDPYAHAAEVMDRVAIELTLVEEELID